MITALFFIAVAVASLVIAAYSYAADRRRRAMLERALAGAEGPAPRSPLLLAPRGTTRTERLQDRFAHYLPVSWLDDARTQERLLRAGYEGEQVMFVYAGVRLVLLLALPALTVLLRLGESFGGMLAYVAFALVVAWIIPVGVLDAQIRKRQERIRRAVPDALDLILVCVEAGVSLEGAMLRVARELQRVHPDLAAELATVIRRVKAGMSREEALKGLHQRTGVEELRTLAANVVQSERWGTSIGRVLRVTAETLRRKRKQRAERGAATAPLKMTVPLVLLILPALFIAILGPTMLSLIESLTR